MHSTKVLVYYYIYINKFLFANVIYLSLHIILLI